MMIDVMPNALPLARDGRARGIAVSTATRYPGAPEYPTIAESGLPGFEASAWTASSCRPARRRRSSPA